MSEGNAQRYEIQLDNEPLFKMYHYAAGTSNDKTIWSDAAKTTPLAQPAVADANGQLTFFADGRYRLKFHDSSDVPISGMDYDDFLITADFATTFEDNQGTVLPSASATNIGHLFTLLDGSNNILGIYQSDGTQYKAMVKFTAAGEQIFDTVVTKTHPWYDVTHTDWGADPTGVLDSTTAIQSAINAAEAAGFGIVYIPGGTYKYSSLSVESSGVILCGAGVDVTILKTTSATADTLVLGDGVTTYNNLVVADLSFETSIVRTAGATIKLNKINRLIIDNVKTDSQIFSIDAPASVVNTSVFINKFEIRQQVAGAGVGISLDGGIHDVYINEFIMNTTGSDPGIGIRYKDANRIWVSNTHLINAGKGVYLFPGAGDACDSLFFENVDITSGNDTGFLIDANTSTSTVTNVVLDNVRVKENELNGIQVTGHANSTLDGVYIDDCQSFGNTQHGISVGKGINIDITNCKIGGNSKGSSGTYNGIDISGGVSQFSVKNCRSGQQAGEADEQGYGLNIATGAGDNFEVLNNNFKNNVTGGINDLSTGTDKLFANNLTDDVVELTAAATSMVIPPHRDTFNLTGTANITNITSVVWDGRIVTFILTDFPDFTHEATGSGQLSLAGGVNFTAGEPNTTLVLVWIATADQWFEVSRSIN
jgi:hypothetical protein